MLTNDWLHCDCDGYKTNDPSVSFDLAKTCCIYAKTTETTLSHTIIMVIFLYNLYISVWYGMVV